MPPKTRRGRLTQRPYQYVQIVKTRFGKELSYFRPPGAGARVALGPASEMGSSAWMARYLAAYQGRPIDRPEGVGADRSSPGTFDALITVYYRSKAFTRRAAGTQKNRRIALEYFRKEHGSKRVVQLTKPLLAQLIDLRAEKTLDDKGRLRGGPGAARDMLCALRELYGFAVGQGHAKTDPTEGVPLPPIESEGHYSWEDADLEQYRSHHALGTVARLALEILLNTGLRRGDVVKVGRDYLRDDGKLAIRPQKTQRKKIDVVIPLHADLQAALAAAPTSLRHQQWLITKTGRPFSVAYFGDCFQAWVAEAGLPTKCTPHGLRYAIVRILLDLGVAPEDVMAITGHTDITTLMKYGKARDRERAAERAMAARANAK